MSIYGTLKEIGNHLAKKQQVIVDTVTEKAPILDIIPFAPATHGLWHVYEEVDEIQGAAFVPINSPLPDVDTVNNLKKIDLDIIGGQAFVPEDTALQMGGKEKYFAKKLPKIQLQSGMDCEKRLYYGNFIRYAIANGTAKDAGGTGNETASIVAIRFEREATGGLYNPESWKANGMLNVQPYYGGALTVIPTGHKYAGAPGYGLRLKGSLGMQISDPRTCAAILNITPTNIPTRAMIDDLLADVRATPGDTKLFMHVKTKNLLNQFKQDSMHMRPDDKMISFSWMDWDGIPVVTSYNLLPFGETATSL